ncbi:MAG: hypothetical protein FWD73_11285 [Polyangiaceae bacterium]|nr:hypothetical protein [Polyangiaceae bacterium]
MSNTLSTRRTSAQPTTQQGDAKSVHRRQQSDQDDASEGDVKHRRHDHDLDALDPAARQAAQLAPPTLMFAQGSPNAVAAAAEPARARMSMEELMPALVKKIAWAGDKNKGSVRLELGAGAYEGTTLVVHSDAGRVRVEVSGKEGADLDQFRQRLGERLRGQGIDVESVT